MKYDEPTGKTLKQLKIELSDRVVGVTGYGADGLGSAQLPTDERDDARLASVINTAYKEIIASDPNWSWLTQPLRVDLSATTGNSNIKLDSAHIPSDTGTPHAAYHWLPPFVSRPPQKPWTFVDKNADIARLAMSRPEVLRAKHQLSDDTSGTPRFVAYWPIRQSDLQTRVRWAMILWPTPSENFTITNDVVVLPYDMSDDDERHIMGADHDETLLAVATRVWYDDDGDDPRKADLYERRAVAAIGRSLNIDRPLRHPGVQMIRSDAATTITEHNFRDVLDEPTRQYEGTDL